MVKVVKFFPLSEIYESMAHVDTKIGSVNIKSKTWPYDDRINQRPFRHEVR